MAAVPSLVYVGGTLRGAGAAPKSGVSFRDREGDTARAQLAKAWRNVGGPVLWGLRCLQTAAGRYGYAARSRSRTEAAGSKAGFPDAKAAFCSPTSSASATASVRALSLSTRCGRSIP